MLKSVLEYQLSPRVTIRAGSRVKLIGSGGDVVYRLPGVWEVLEVLKRGKRRTYLEIRDTGMERQPGGRYTVFVDGPNYRRHGFKFTPYKVKRA